MTDAMQRDRLLIRNATLVDGTGAPRRPADVCIVGDRIDAVFEPGRSVADAETTIDAAGRVLAPGFIDTHTHDDNAVLVNPDMTAKISQGVTTVVTGNCGISLAPIGPVDPPPPLNLLGGKESFRYRSVKDYAAAVNAASPSVNVAALIGHSTLRIGTMPRTDRKANAGEIDQMRNLLAEGLEAGAIGFSTGLFYQPNAAADMDEVVALAEILSDKGGIYATHMRDEHDHVMESLEESFETARRAKVPLVISHHKCAGPQNWGRTRETLPLIDRARQRQDVGLDAYPYVAGSTVLTKEFFEPDVRIVVTWSEPFPEFAGRDLDDIAGVWGCAPEDAIVRLEPAGAIYFQIDEQDVRRILAFPPTMIGSDGLPHDRHPHPRLWGTFPRVLGHYCRDVGLFSLEQAVHKMTGLSAASFRLKDRGVIRAGAFADLVIFDPDEIIDRATFERPKEPAAGIDYVFVNGRLSWAAAEPTGNRAGRCLIRS